MPITFDLSKDELFASYIERGRLKGERQGRLKGERQGRLEGEKEGVKKVVLLQLEKRFGRLPASIAKRLARLSDAEARKLALAIIDAKSLKELFGNCRP